jgi:hypothetical protein
MKCLRILACLLPLALAACGLSDQQKADYESVQRAGVSPATYDKMVHGDPLALSDIKNLARAGVSDGVTIRYLRDHETVYVLNSADIADLHKAGVSESVIDYMLRTSQLYGPGPDVYVGVDPFFWGPGPWWGGPYWGGYYHGYHRWH